MPSGDHAVEMPRQSPGIDRCGGRGPGWLNSQPPEEPGETKTAVFCFEWRNRPCNIQRTGRVTNCGDYYVYDLKEVPCRYRYCGTGEREESGESRENFLPISPFANPFLG